MVDGFDLYVNKHWRYFGGYVHNFMIMYLIEFTYLFILTPKVTI